MTKRTLTPEQVQQEAIRFCEMTPDERREWLGLDLRPAKVADVEAKPKTSAERQAAAHAYFYPNGTKGAHVQTLDGEYIYPANHALVKSFPHRFKPWEPTDPKTESKNQ